MALMAYPHEGDLYGFPKEIPANILEDHATFPVWLVESGYPSAKIYNPTYIMPNGFNKFLCHMYDTVDSPADQKYGDPTYVDPYSEGGYLYALVGEGVIQESGSTM